MESKRNNLSNCLKQLLNIYFPLFFKRPGLIYALIRGYFKTIVLHKPVLKSIEFSITTLCNSNCKMCFAHYYRNSNKNELDVEEVRKVWLQAKRLGAIGSYLLGGEPTMRKDLFDILEALEAKRYLVGVVTNSLVLTEGFIKKLKDSGVTFLSFSLDSIDEQENDRLRGCPGHYRKVISAISVAKRYGFRTDISYLLSHSTLPRVEEFIAFALKLGVDYIAPSVMVPVGRWKDNDAEILTPDDWININRLIQKYPCLKFDFLNNFSLRQSCPGGIEKVAIGPYGDIMPCNVNPVSFGNIREELLETIWKRIHRFKYFALGRNYSNCVVAADREYQEEVLRHISETECQPVLFSDHPKDMSHYFV